MVDHADEVEAGDASGQGGERVAKALARAGVASRRDVERLIGEGRVKLNGQVLDTPAVKVGPEDVLTVDGRVVNEREGTRLWRYHKPVGLLTSHKDPGGRPTVFEHLPAGLPRVISVGRLDLNSEGLLLLTNDGELARALELPSTAWVRRYRARAHGRIDQTGLDALQDGIEIEGVRYGPIEAKLDKAKEGAAGSNLWITVGLTEGKNREVRRVLEALGLKVNRLIRLAYGPFNLGTLALGEAEEVGPRVMREQLVPILPDIRPAAGGGGLGVLAAARRTGTGQGEGAAAPSALAPAPEKKVYKPGWARPKKRPPSHPVKAAAKPRPAHTAGTDLTFAPAKPRPVSGRPDRSSGTPAPQATPKPGGPRRRP